MELEVSESPTEDVPESVLRTMSWYGVQVGFKGVGESTIT